MIIGLLGPAGAGKTTIAKFLCERYGAVRYSLAGPLKEIAQSTLGFTDDQLYGTQEQKETVDPRYGFSPRWFLQRLGTEGIRSVLGADTWVNALLERIEADHPHVAVIDDVRFGSEVDRLRLMGSEVWRLTPPAFYTQSVNNATLHTSENQWRDASADYEIRPTLPGVDVLVSLAQKRMEILGYD